MDIDWAREFPGAVTVTDTAGTILYMNHRAAAAFAAEGGSGLVDTSVREWHAEPSRAMRGEMLRTERPDVDAIEKKGVRKLIHQSPWYRDGRYAGFVELSLELPAEIPHFVRG